MNKIFKNTMPITKVNRKKRIVYGIVYEPDTPDAHDHFASKEVIEKAAHNFLLNFGKMDEQHDFIAGAGKPVESFIVRAGDRDFVYTKGVNKGRAKVGAWVIGAKVLDDSVWDKILRGEIKGFSMSGVAKLGKQTEMESEWYDENGNYKSVWD